MWCFREMAIIAMTEKGLGRVEIALDYETNRRHQEEAVDFRNGSKLACLEILI